MKSWFLKMLRKLVMKDFVFCEDCSHHGRCQSERVYKSENVQNPYCCLGERKESN